jgi:hypothetical protein
MRGPLSDVVWAGLAAGVVVPMVGFGMAALISLRGAVGEAEMVAKWACAAGLACAAVGAAVRLALRVRR